MQMNLKNKRIFTVVATLLIYVLNVSGQLYFQEENSSRKGIMVRDESKQIFKFPWVGGMNACQFGEIDLDINGVKDLVVFERHGNRIMTFINGGQPGTVDYTYAPEYIEAFPEIHDWAIFKDYNNDGLEDIFTYSFEYPGIVVYKNISQNELKFELEVYPYLTSLQGSGYVNILVTSVDYPGIEDIDNDGDLDILTFWGLGSFVEYHQNQSMELYGIPDSLTFIEVSQCWGRFAENEESNIVYLDTCFGKNEQIQPIGVEIPFKNERHTGSTFLLLDLDADNDKDLLLGDVDYPDLIELVNGGSAEEAYMISQDSDFPSYNVPIDIFSFPVAAYIDINNNDIKDLIVSPFDPNPITSENYSSVWVYENTGENNLPQFNFVKDNFLQGDMLDFGSGAYPILIDYNGDGLQDLFVSNFGYYMWSYYLPGMFLKSVYWSKIALFENTGTIEQAEFTRVAHDFGHLHSKHLTGVFPAFADLDGDDDLDMVYGQEDGTLTYLENLAGIGQMPEFAEAVSNYFEINVGNFSTPQLFDLNKDGLFDLIIGEQAGNINYYVNTGSVQSPVFEFVTDSLGEINVTNVNMSYYGYSTPCFYLTAENDIELIVGSEQGKIFYFKDIENNLDGAFTENDSLFIRVGEETENYNHGMRTGAAIGQLSNDGLYDLIVGNYAGGLNYFQQIKNPEVASVSKKGADKSPVLVFPNPAVDQITFKSKGFINNEKINLSVYNIKSKRIFDKNYIFAEDIQLDISDYKAGVYYYILSSLLSNQKYSGRFVKVK